MSVLGRPEVTDFPNGVWIWWWERRGNWGGQDKSRASFGHALVGFWRHCAYGKAQNSHIFLWKRAVIGSFLYGSVFLAP